MKELCDRCLETLASDAKRKETMHSFSAAADDTEIQSSREHQSARPWRRLWARSLDAMLFSLLLSPITNTIWNHTTSYLIPVIMVWAALFVAFAIFEAALLSQTGTTLGKYFFALKVTTQDGENLSFGQAIIRYVAIYWRQQLIIPPFLAYRDLKEYGSTKWDTNGSFVVSSAPIQRWRWFAFILIYCVMFIVNQHAHRQIPRQMTERVAKMRGALLTRWLGEDQVTLDSNVLHDPIYSGAKTAEKNADFSTMLERAKKLVQAFPHSGLAYKCLGDAYYYADAQRDALAAINKAIQIHPGDMVAWHDLGNIQMKLKQFSEAENSYNEAIKYAPGEPLPLVDMAELLIEKGQKGDAIRFIQQAEDSLTTKLFNNHNAEIHEEDVWNGIGDDYMAVDRPANAADAYEHAAKLDPNSAVIWGNLGRAYFDLQRNEDAVMAYKRSTNLDSSDAYEWYSLGCGYRRLNQLDAAQSALLQAIKLDPSDGHAWYSLGSCYLDNNRPADAISALEHSTRLMPNRQDMWFLLGTAYDKANRIDDAIFSYRKALNIVPDYTAAKDALNRDISQKLIR